MVHNCHGRGRPEYYLSAYGLALKHGFRGTEEQWLESLKPVLGTDYFTEEQKKQFVADVLDKVRQGDDLKEVVEEWITANWEKLIAESDIKTGWASLDLEQALSEDVKLTADGRTVSGPGYYLTDPIPCGGLPYKRVRIKGRAAAGDVIMAQYQYNNEFVEATGWDAQGEFDAVITLYPETVHIRVQSNGEPPVVQVLATLPEGGNTGGLDEAKMERYLEENNYAKTDDIPVRLSELEPDSTHRTVTDAEKTKWNDAANKIAAIETDTVEVEESPTMLINTGFTAGGGNNTGSDALHCVVTADYYPAASLTSVRYNSTGNNGYQIQYCAYDAARSMISKSNWLRDASAQFGVEGGYTLPDDAVYFRASFKPRSGTAAATEDTPAAIACVFTFVKQMAAGELPGYYETPINNAINNIKTAQMEYGSHGIAFAFVTDMHQSKYKASNAGHAGEIIRRVATETGIGFVLNGGDNINEGSKAEMTADIDNIRANLARAGLPVLNAIGNHDSNTPGEIGNYTSSEIQEMRFSRDEIFGLFFRDDIHRLRFASDADCTWVYDDATRKTRVIGFDTGNGSDISPDYNALFDALKATPDGWAIILTAHMIRNEGAVSGIGSKVFSIVDAYNAKAGTVTVNGSALDFSDGCRGHVHLIVAGHTHFDSSNTTPGGVPVVICDCDSCNRTHGAIYAEIGTITEGCVSFLTVDYQNGNVNCFRVGRGYDRVFTSTAGVPGWSIENNSVAVTESQFFESITETKQFAADLVSAAIADVSAIADDVLATQADTMTVQREILEVL